LKYFRSLMVVLTFILLAGCTNNQATNDIYRENGRTIQVHDEPGMYNPIRTNNERENQDNFGYVRHQKSPIASENVAYKDIPNFNREAVADTISRLCVQLPNVEDCATLVTDDEVLIAYQTDTKDRNMTADQVKRTALSIVPRYFHVYITDNPNLRKDIENFSSLDSDSRDVQKMIDSTIKKMLQSSPQGGKVSDGENANGEAQRELNEDMDRNDISERINVNKNK
jgi:Sporulation lipoprotein YhcN/YlaJ (Spore_YhcN_YlaJ)